jgi:hypothetical protein
MIKVVGQATQKNGTTPEWTLTGICTAGERSGTGTYKITCSKDNNNQKIAVLASAERGGIGTERLTAEWNNNVLTIKNYTGQASTTLGDCWLTVTLIEDLTAETTMLKFGEEENRLIVKDEGSE